MRYIILVIALLFSAVSYAQTFRTSVEKVTPPAYAGMKPVTETKNSTYKFEIDTIGRTITRSNVIGPTVYKITSKGAVHQTENGYNRTFNVSQTDRITGTITLNVTKNKTTLTVRMKTMIGGRERELGTYRYEGECDSNTLHTRYLSTFFHDINQETPLEDHPCDITIADNVIMVFDRNSSSEMKMYYIIEKKEPETDFDGNVSTTYIAPVNGRPDERYIITVTIPKNKDSASLVKICHTVYGKPVVTKTFLTPYL